MKGSPAKLGTIQGTAGHASALKMTTFGGVLKDAASGKLEPGAKEKAVAPAPNVDNSTKKKGTNIFADGAKKPPVTCLLYTSDAADE